MGTGGSLRQKGTRDALVDSRGNVGDQAQKYNNQGEAIPYKVFFGNANKPSPDDKYKRSVR